MAVTAPASLAKIRAEFGGASPPANLKAYYRGGPYVPNTPTNAAIATDPNLLAISQFVNASAVTASVSLDPSYTMYSFVDSGSPTTPTAQLSFFNNGQLWTYDNSGPGTDHSPDWGVGLVASEYEIMARNLTGNVPAGPAFNTWHNLGTSRTWLIEWPFSYDGERSADFAVDIRKVGTTSPVVTTGISMFVSKGAPI